MEWSTSGIEGCHRFLRRLFALVNAPVRSTPGPEADRARHRTIGQVTEAIEQFRYNSAISAMMVFLSTVERAPWREGVETLVHLVSPFAPFAAEEIWHRWGHRGSIHQEPWPAWDEAATADAEVGVPVQVAGRVRGKVTLPADADQAAAEAAALAALGGQVAGRRLRAHVPGRMISYE